MMSSSLLNLFTLDNHVEEDFTINVGRGKNRLSGILYLSLHKYGASSDSMQAFLLYITDVSNALSQ